MNRIVGLAGLVLIGLFILDSFAPLIGFEEGFLGDRLLIAMGLALLPIGVWMAVQRNREKLRERQEKRRAIEREMGGGRR